MTELYTMQRYLQYDTLKAKDIYIYRHLGVVFYYKFWHNEPILNKGDCDD